MTKRTKTFLILGVVLLVPLGWLVGIYMSKAIKTDATSGDDEGLGEKISDGLDKFFEDLGDAIFVDDVIESDASIDLNNNENIT